MRCNAWLTPALYVSSRGRSTGPPARAEGGLPWQPSPTALRSRRALLAAAAGSAAAVVASAALPLTAAAAPATSCPSRTTRSSCDDVHQRQRRGRHRVQRAVRRNGRRIRRRGNEPRRRRHRRLERRRARPMADFVPVHDVHRRLRQSAPASPTSNAVGTGVWGDSPDIGVYGSGGSGVVGFGAIGVEGRPTTRPAASASGPRRGTPSPDRAEGHGQGLVEPVGPHDDAQRRVLQDHLPRRRDVVKQGIRRAGDEPRRAGGSARSSLLPGKFTVYLNTTLISSAVVSWFVLD